MSIFDSTSTAPSTDGGVAGTPPAVEAPPVADAGVPAAPVVEAPPQVNYLDTDQFGSHVVKIKVGGEEVEKPLSEALSGFMMQQDYTRKTQELREAQRRLSQADQLAAALDANPASTLRELAEVYDLDPSAGFSPVQRLPEEQALLNQQRSLAAQQQAIARERLQAEVMSLRAEFGQDIDLAPAAQYAQSRGVDLTTAYRAVAFDQLRQQQAAAAQQARVEQARAAQVAHDASATQRGSVSTPPARVSSIAEAWAAAKAELNL